MTPPTRQEHLLTKAFLALDDVAPDPSDLYGGFVLHLRGRPPTLRELRAGLAAGVPRLPCLTLRLLATRDGKVRWEPDPSFDIAHHVRELPAGPPAALPAQTLLHGVPLDATRPRWHLLLMPGVGDGWALCYLAHHAVQDITAMLHTVRTLLDDDSGGPPAGHAPTGRTGTPRFGLGLLPLVPDVLRTLRPAAATPLTVAGTPRRVLAGHTIGLARLTETARAAEVTVNQVHLAVGSSNGLTGHGGYALVPVDTRIPAEHAAESGFGNRIGLMQVPLPRPDRPRRLRRVTAPAGRHQMARHRNALRTLMNNSPERPASWFLSRVTAPERNALVVSNIRIDRPLSVFGALVERVEGIPWLPPGLRCFSFLITHHDLASLSVLTPGPPACSPQDLCEAWGEHVTDLHRAVSPRSG